MLIKLFLLFMFCLIASSLQSCAQVDVKQMTYKALRQQDCRMNEPNAFCERGFTAEYQEYERIRQEFIRDTQTSASDADIGTESLMRVSGTEPALLAQDIAQ